MTTPSSRKAAILLAALEQEAARAVLQQFTPDERRAIAVEIGRLGTERPTSEETERVLREFSAAQPGTGIAARGGVSTVRELLSTVVPADEMASVMQQVEAVVGRVPFDFLSKRAPEDLVPFIAEEHPQVIGLIMAHLPPEHASKVLDRLPVAVQVEVIRRMAQMEQMSPEIVAQVEKTLESKLSSLVSGEMRRIEGGRAAAEILVRSSRETEAAILQAIEEGDAALADRIRSRMFAFDDLARCNDRGIQNLLKNVDRAQLSLALKLPAPDVSARIFRNMSKRAAEALQQDIESLGPVLMRDVTAARRGIESIARQLEHQGELAVEGRGAEEMIS